MWILYSLLAAFFAATGDAATKRLLGGRRIPAVAWGRVAFGGLFLSPLLFRRWPPLDVTFWRSILLLLPLEIAALFLYLRAIARSPLSLTAPLLSLTPVFLLATGWLILGEKASRIGVAGVALIAAGTYLLSLGSVGDTAEPTAPPVPQVAARSPTFSREGTRLMILAAFLYSLTASIGKVAVLHSDPLFFAPFYYLLLAAILTPLAAQPGLPGERFLPIRSGLPVGAAMGLQALFHFLAIRSAPVAYVIGLKRTGLLFSVLYGGLLFREREMGRRLSAAALMVVGSILVSIG